MKVRTGIVVGTRAGGWIAPRVDPPEDAGVGPGLWWWAVIIVAGAVALWVPFR